MRNSNNYRRYKGRSGGHDGAPRNHNNDNNRPRYGVSPQSLTFDSNCNDQHVKGNPQVLAEKYLQLAKEANGDGNKIARETYLQHSEHYFRVHKESLAQYNEYLAEKNRQQQLLNANNVSSSVPQTPVIESVKPVVVETMTVNSSVEVPVVSSAPAVEEVLPVVDSKPQIVKTEEIVSLPVKKESHKPVHKPHASKPVAADKIVKEKPVARPRVAKPRNVAPVADSALNSVAFLQKSVGGNVAVEVKEDKVLKYEPNKQGE